MLMLAAALLGLSGLRVDSGVWSLMAAGVLNTFRATGLALGIALMGAVLTASGGGAADRPAAFVDGFSTAVTINAVIAIAAAIVAALTAHQTTGAFRAQTHRASCRHQVPSSRFQDRCPRSVTQPPEPLEKGAP